MDVDLTKDSVLNLITDAYGDSEEGNALRKKVRSFYKLQKQIPEKYQKFFSSQLDHIVPLNFLTQIRSDIPATDLLRINPLPGFLNSRAFKAQLDQAIGAAKRTNDKEALEAYSQLRTFLPEVLGGISKTGKITDFGAETLTEDKSLSKAQLKQTKKIYCFFRPCSITNIFWAPSAKIRLKPAKKPITKYSILNFLINN